MSPNHPLLAQLPPRARPSNIPLLLRQLYRRPPKSAPLICRCYCVSFNNVPLESLRPAFRCSCVSFGNIRPACPSKYYSSLYCPSIILSILILFILKSVVLTSVYYCNRACSPLSSNQSLHHKHCNATGNPLCEPRGYGSAMLPLSSVSPHSYYSRRRRMHYLASSPESVCHQWWGESMGEAPWFERDVEGGTARGGHHWSWRNRRIILKWAILRTDNIKDDMVKPRHLTSFKITVSDLLIVYLLGSH